MNSFDSIPKPTKRYMVIEYPIELEDSLKEEMNDSAITYFDDCNLETAIASAYTFLRHPQLQKKCRYCQINEAIDGNYCSEECAEDSRFNNLEAQATGN